MDDADATSERNNWTSDNADNFHWVLSQHTWFVNDVLQLEHRYLDIRDIREVENLEEEFENSGLPLTAAEKDNRIIKHLEMTNSSNPNKDVKRWFRLLRELQFAAGSKHSVRQINTKHINTRSRWSVPFKSLNEVGYLIKNQALRGAKRATAEEFHSRKEPVQRTNIEKKNLPAVKALRKYVVCRYIYWDDELSCVPSAEKLAHMPPVSSEMEDNSEPERWMRAMIRRHGQQMVEYLDVCAINLANNYMTELIGRGEVGAENAGISLASNIDMVRLYLNRMVGEIMRISKASAARRSAISGPSDKDPKRPSLKGSILKPVAEAIAAPTYASAFSSATEANKPESYGSQQDYAYENRNTFSVKRSKSHSTFNVGNSGESRKESWESAHNDGKRNSLHFPSANISSAQGSVLDFTPYGNISAIASGLFSANEAEKPQQYDDEYFTQFINSDAQILDMYAAGSNSNSNNNNLSGSSSGDTRPVMQEGKKNVTWEKESPAPTELLDAIINLSMNSSGNNSINIAQLNERNGIYGTTDFSLPQSHDMSSIGIPLDQSMQQQMQPGSPLTMMSTATQNSIYIQNSLMQDQRYIQEAGNSAQMHSPYKLSRSSSDTNTHVTESGSKSSSPYQDGGMNSGAPGMFRSPTTPFTFKIPTNIQADGRLGPLPQTQNGGNPNNGFQSPNQFSNQVPAPIMAQSMSFTQLPPNMGGMPTQHQSLLQQQQQQQAYQMQMPESAASTSKLSTTLVYVDGVPKYVELVHDNADVQPNPILLPITRTTNMKN
ncbi:hypothetical protein EV175_001049 [Coemansia sp. RSA 1933]|nr:hypothetical protein EV175_001049 [Coemansia sp. RSA 1933]